MDSVPPGAAIAVDGADSGYFTPTVLRDLPIGPHRVDLALDCRVAASTVQVEPTIVTRLELALEKGHGTLELTTAPAGAFLSLDGEPVGTTPLRTDLACGDHSLLLELEGHHPLPYDGTIGHGERVSLDLALAPIEYGRLVVVPEPLDAKVLVDGEGVGRGALTLDGIVVGSHEVEVRAAGLTSQHRTVDIHRDEVARIELSLVNPFPGVAGEPRVAPVEASRTRHQTRGRVLAALLLGAGAGLGAHAGVTWGRVDAAYDEYMSFSREGAAEAFYDDSVAPARVVLVVDLTAAVALLGSSAVVFRRSKRDRGGDGGGDR